MSDLMFYVAFFFVSVGLVQSIWSIWLVHRLGVRLNGMCLSSADYSTSMYTYLEDHAARIRRCEACLDLRGGE